MSSRPHYSAGHPRRAPYRSLADSFALFCIVLGGILGGFALLAQLGVVHAELPSPDFTAALPSGGQAVRETLPSAPAEPAQVELQLQEPELPNGCEATSLAMALTAAGYPADKTEIAFAALPAEGFWYDSNGTRHGADPDAAYAGDPSSPSGGWYCLEGPAAAAADSWIQQCGGSSGAEILTGLDRRQLESKLQAGVPVVAWVTRDYGPARYADYYGWLLPDGSWYTPYDNLHCVLVAGLEPDGSYRVADPLAGWQTVDPDSFWAGFQALGCRALAIAPAE